MLKKFFCILIAAAILLCGCGTNTHMTSGSSKAASEAEGCVSRIRLDFCGDSFLRQLADRNWRHDSVQTVLGRRSAYFDRYDVYSDQGIGIKYSELAAHYPETIGYYAEPTGNIENILLNGKYNGEIADGVSMKSSEKEIVSRLGKPQFIDASLNLFGYRADDFYLFFVGTDQIGEISVYPVFAEPDLAEAVRRSQALCDGAAYSRELAVKLTEDFAALFHNCNYHYVLNLNDRWSSRAGKVGFASYTEGIEIRWDDRDGQRLPILRIYGNSDLPPSSGDAADITDADGNVLIDYRLTEDLVFVQEQKRIKGKTEAARRAAEEGAVSPNGNVVIVDNHDDVSPLVTGFNVLFKDGSEPDFTVRTSPSFGRAAWIDNRYFLCNFSLNSLMIYDLLTRQSKLLSSSISFSEVLPDKITADDGSGDAGIVIRYSFNKDGSIVLSCDDDHFTDRPWIKTE